MHCRQAAVLSLPLLPNGDKRLLPITSYADGRQRRDGDAAVS